MTQHLDVRDHLQSLVGREIHTVAGSRNRVVQLTGSDIIVSTSRSPSGQPVPIDWVRRAIERLEDDGEIEISVKSVGYRSAFVGAVLLQIPGATVVEGASPPRIRLMRGSA